MGKYSKLAPIVGALIMVFAMRMDISVDGYINLHKATDRQNMLIFGGFIFLGGLVLFALESIKGKKTVDRNSTAARSIPPISLSVPRNPLAWNESSTLARVVIASLVSIPIAIVIWAISKSAIALALIPALILFALKRDSGAVILLRFIIGVLIAVMLLLMLIATDAQSYPNEEHNDFLSLMFAALSAGFYWAILFSKVKQNTSQATIR